MDKLIFDLETTGNIIAEDRIVELGIKVIGEDGTVKLCKAKRYNPGKPIHPAATDIHGITNDDVKDCPSFKEDAKKLKKLFENKIIITYNGMVFDIPILMMEFDRVGVDVDLSGRFIDVLKNERRISSHALGAVYKKYTGKELENAHNAQADLDATWEILGYHSKLISDDELYEDTSKMADFFGKLKFDDEGYLIFNFGKAKGKRIIDESRYAGWVIDNNTFPSQVRKLVREEQTKHLFKNTTKKNPDTPAKKAFKESLKKDIKVPKSTGYQPLFTDDDDPPF